MSKMTISSGVRLLIGMMISFKCNCVLSSLVSLLLLCCRVYPLVDRIHSTLWGRHLDHPTDRRTWATLRSVRPNQVMSVVATWEAAVHWLMLNFGSSSKMLRYRKVRFHQASGRRLGRCRQAIDRGQTVTRATVLGHRAAAQGHIITRAVSSAQGQVVIRCMGLSHRLDTFTTIRT